MSVVFLLVALAALAFSLVTVSGVQHTTHLLAVQGTRAHFAARAGVDWAISRIVNAGAAGLDCGPGTTSFGIEGYTVEVGCASTPVTEGTRSYTAYDLTATATRGDPGEADFAARTVIASVAF